MSTWLIHPDLPDSPQKHVELIGDGVATDIVVTHNLGTRAVVWSLYEISSLEDKVPDVVRTSLNTLTLSFNAAPGVDAYEITVMG